jgi:hypothetical protein
VKDGDTHMIAKLSLSTDTYPMVKAEAAAMELARRVGIDVPLSRIVTSLGREVLLVERFDRPGNGERRMMVSGLTMQGLDSFLGARYSSYPDMLDALLARSADPASLGRAVFARIVFNIAIGNIDDHARNHAAFWDGESLELTRPTTCAHNCDRARPRSRRWTSTVAACATANSRYASRPRTSTVYPNALRARLSSGRSKSSTTTGQTLPTWHS